MLEKMATIQYGFVNREKKVFLNDEDMIENHYCLETPEELLESKVGVCWDQVELERYWFTKAKIPFQTFCFIAYHDSSCPTHTFLVYQEKNHYFWFEHSWAIFAGIHEYPSLTALLKDIKKRFLVTEVTAKGIEAEVILYQYSKPPIHASVSNFYEHVEKGKEISL